MTPSKKTKGFIKKYLLGLKKLLPGRRRGKIVFNKMERNISAKPVIYYMKRVKPETYFRVSGAIFGDVEDPKAALIALRFYDARGNDVTLEDTQGLTPSPGIGYYKYLPVSHERLPFFLMFYVPKNCCRVKVTLSHWNHPHKNIYLAPGAHVKRIRDIFDTKLPLVMNNFSDFLYRRNVGLEDARDFISRTSECHQTDPFLVAHIIFSQYNETHPAIAAYFGVILFEKHPDGKLAEKIYQTFHRAGSVYDKNMFAGQLSSQDFPSFSPTRIKKIEEEKTLLEKPFPLPTARAKTPYLPEKKALYLLHNALPYNSGGYAARTHGLLNGVAQTSDFTAIALTRPGYPADHKKHINGKLPATLPPVTEIDKATYYIGDQTTRRNSMTIEQYVAAFAREARELAIANKCAVIHAASNYPYGFAAIAAARSLGIASIYEVRGLWELTRQSREPLWNTTELCRLSEKLETQAMQEADYAITITEALKKLMQKRGVARDIMVVPNAVDAARFAPRERDAELAKKLGLADKIVIGYLGSLVNYEGLDDLLRAFAKLAAAGIHNIKLLIVGDGAYENELRKLSASLQLGDMALFTGRVPHEEAPRYLSVMDIMPFPRKPYAVCETVSPLKPLEAMASEKAVIVSSCAAMAEMVENGKTGLHFKKADIDDLTRRLRELIENPELRARLGKQARAWVERERDWKAVAAKVSAIYDKIYEDVSRKAV